MPYSRVMLDVASEIFGSKTLPRLLSQLAEQPGQAMTAGELAHALGGINRDSLYRALGRAERAGLIRRETRGHVSTFQIAADSPIYPHLKGLLAMLLGLGPQLRQALAGRPGVDHAFLYGSYASGQDTPHSDIDLFVIGTVSSLELAAALRPLLAELQRELNVSSYSRPEVESRLAAGDPFFLDVWAKPKIILVGDEADLPSVPAQPEVSPYFAQEIAVGRNWCTAAYVLGGVPASRDQLTERLLDEVEAWAGSVRPDAVVEVATPSVGRWQVPVVGAGGPEWMAWLYPGPMLSIRRGLHPHDQGGIQVVSLPDLVAWWRELSKDLPRLLFGLGCRRARLGLTIDTYGSDERIAGLDFMSLPAARGVRVGQMPAWAHVTPDFDLPDLPLTLLAEAVRRLLRQWSYRGIEPTVAALDFS
jgi:predicted nucleotidyltransferase